MKRIILYILISVYFSTAADFSHKNILIALHPQQAALDLSNGKTSTSVSALNALIDSYNISKVEKWLRSADENDVIDGVDLSKIYRLRFAQRQPNQTLQKALSEFSALAEVQSAQKEPLIKIAMPLQPFVPDDPSFSRQWHLQRIQADYAWALWQDSIPGDPDILIGVVDTGLDYTHPDLQDAAYINPGEDIDGDGLFTEADLNGVDDDSNGFVDDVRGWDFAGAGENSGQDNDIRPPSAGNYQILSHGTHVSGIAGAVTNNELGVGGVSFRSKIIATKQSYDDDVEYGYLWNAYDGILYCAKMGATVINCSWGSSYGGSYGQDVINNAVQNYGSIIVCAAGNDNTNNDDHHFYPSDYDNVVTVAALNSSDRKASFSNYGGVIDISAPGVAILSTIHYNAGAYASWAGTSMASPVVAGSFALLKSWFPQKDREWLIDALLQGADSLDNLQSAYEGKLGAGRVNVFNPIAQRIYPRLKISDYNLVLLDDNGDGQLSPGESAAVHLQVAAKKNWQDAYGLKVILSTSDENVTIVDSMAEWGYLAAGRTLTNEDDQLIFRLSPSAHLGPLEITARFEANTDTERPYSDRQKMTFYITQNQKGFPVSAISIAKPLTAFKQAKNDSALLAAVGGDNQLHVFTADGKIKSGFPVDLQGYTSMPPSIADMDGDGAMDIVIMNRYGLLQVLDSGGRLLLEKDFNEAVYGNISLADVDADSVPEIIFGTMRKKIHVFKMDSTEMDSFPKTFSTLIDRGIALVDVDADERPELLFGTFDRKLHLLQYDGKEMEGWPLELSSRIIHTPIISKINSANVFVVTTLDKKLLILNEKAQIIAQATLAERVSAAPAFADMDKDGVPEIVFSTSDAVLHLLATDGREVSPFPLHLPEVVNSSPVVYDLKGDGSPDIILTSEAGRVLVFDKQGQSLENFPAQLNGNLNASPVISDLDGDGDVEIISGGAEGLFVLDLSASYAESNLWQSWLGNNQRTGFYAQPVTGIATDEPNIIVSRAGLKQNYPNPFGRGADLRGNPRTAISFQLSAAGFTELVVYNILGQKIKTLFAGATAKGRHRFMWDGRNDLQQEVGSGIYFYRLKGKDFTISRRMLLLR